MDFNGTWHIFEMEDFDADYFNMEVQAFIEISGAEGDFQFGLVSGSLYGKPYNIGNETRYEFNWEGVDECEPISGSGWLKHTQENQLEGEFRFYGGDEYSFLAKSA